MGHAHSQRHAAGIGYGSGLPGQQQDPLYGYFTAVSGQNGQICAKTLQHCLTQANFFGCYKPFSLETCRQIIRTLDRNMSGSMGFDEFKEMWAGLVGWKEHFMISDRNRSGTIDPQELNQALYSLGYMFSPQTMNSIMQRFSSNGNILFDDYVACCVKLTNLTYHFQQRMLNPQGMAAYEYEDFIQCIMKI